MAILVFTSQKIFDKQINKMQQFYQFCIFPIFFRRWEKKNSHSPLTTMHSNNIHTQHTLRSVHKFYFFTERKKKGSICIFSPLFFSFSFPFPFFRRSDKLWQQQIPFCYQRQLTIQMFVQHQNVLKQPIQFQPILI